MDSQYHEYAYGEIYSDDSWLSTPSGMCDL